MADKYLHLSPYNYCANNPILFVDPDGKKIIIGNNTSQAMTNLAMMAATNQGRERVNSLITSPSNYYTSSVFWTRNSTYDALGQKGRARTIYYPSTALQPYQEGGRLKSVYIMSHELNHAYDHDNGENIYDVKTRESTSVYFTNYMRSVYGDGNSLRTQRNHPDFNLTFTNKESAYNPTNEKVTNFTETFSISAGGDKYMGFSYDKSENGEKAQASYIIGVTTEAGVYAYRIFDNKDEYNAALERIQNLKKKEDEK